MQATYKRVKNWFLARKLWNISSPEAGSQLVRRWENNDWKDHRSTGFSCAQSRSSTRLCCYLVSVFVVGGVANCCCLSGLELELLDVASFIRSLVRSVPFRSVFAISFLVLHLAWHVAVLRYTNRTRQRQSNTQNQSILNAIVRYDVIAAHELASPCVGGHKLTHTHRVYIVHFLSS